jgi:hypothetical protein
MLEGEAMRKSVETRLTVAERLTQIGRSVIRLDGQAKVSGAMRYAADIERPGMIWGTCLHSRKT